MDLIQVEQKANEFVNKGMITEALEQFQIILKKKPNDLRIRKTMADLYVKIDDKWKSTSILFRSCRSKSQRR